MAKDPRDDDLNAKPTAGMIRKRWEDGSRDLAEQRRAWWINTCFVNGQQWIRWDRYNANVVEMPEPDTERVRMTANRLRPAMASLLGRLTSKPLAFENRPTAADDATVFAARLGTAILDTAHDVQDWERVRAFEILDAYAGASSMVYFDWNGRAGEVLEYDESNERVIGTGEIELCAAPITEFALQPGLRGDPYKTAFWTSARAMPRTEAKRIYRMSKLPAADANMGKSALMSRLLSETGRIEGDDTCLVITCWQIPREGSKGWVATVIGDEIVDGPHDWPFPFNEPNFAIFTQWELTHHWAGSTAMSDAIDLQGAYNCVLSANVEACQKAGNSRIAIDDLSAGLQDEMTDEPGEMLVYSSATQKPPFWLNAPGPTRGLVVTADTIDKLIDDALSHHGVSRGEINVNRTPASTIAQLAEKDDTPLGRFAHNQAAGWSRLGRLILKTYEEKVTEQREVTVMGSAATATASRKWNGAMLRGQTDVTVPLDATKPFSEVANRASVVEMWNLGMIPKDPRLALALMHIDVGDDALDVLDPDAAKAKRENVKLAAGEVCYPALFDDHGKHIAELNAFRKSGAYEELPPEYQFLFEQHAQGHATLHAEQLNQQLMASQIAGPGAVMRPQADEPPGSIVPPPVAQRQMAGPPAGNPQPTY